MFEQIQSLKQKLREKYQNFEKEKLLEGNQNYKKLFDFL